MSKKTEFEAGVLAANNLELLNLMDSEIKTSGYYNQRHWAECVMAGFGWSTQKIEGFLYAIGDKK